MFAIPTPGEGDNQDASAGELSGRSAVISEVRPVGGATPWTCDPVGADPHTVRLRHHPTASGAARRHLTRFLSARSVPAGTIDDARLVVSELVANAVQHGRPTEHGCLSLAWVLDASHLVLTVEDGGDAPIVRRSPDAQSTGGRGLHILDSLTRSWTVRRQDGTTMVCASIALPT
jgi:serine/threonine-protein kinase RsbW